MRFGKEIITTTYFDGVATKLRTERQESIKVENKSELIKELISGLEKQAHGFEIEWVDGEPVRVVKKWLT